MKKEKRTRNWSTIIYPRQTEQDETTCPDNWADILGELGVKCAVSPLHDKDVNGDGTPKKPHRHVLVAFEGVKSREQAIELFDRIGGVGAEPVNSLYGMTRYLTHMDNPEKAQYSTMDVLTFGGFEYRRYASTKEDEEKETVGHIGEIMEIVQNNLIFGFSDLAEVLMTERPELFTVFRKNPYFFAQYLKSKQEIYRNALDR
jgi:hypothetical protein